MSSDPKRLLEPGAGASDAESALLRAAGNAEPPDGARAAAWAALEAKLPGGGSGGHGGGSGGHGGGGGGAPAGASGMALATKAAIGLLLAGGAAIAVAVVVRSSPPPSKAEPALRPTVISTTTSAAPATVASEESLPSISVTSLPSAPSTAPSPASPVAPRSSASAAEGPSASPIDALLDERSLLGSAREAHRRGDDRGALTILETAQRRHPNGVLGQEREVVAIEALAQLGDREQASARAKTFLTAFPTSPHAAHVRDFVR